MSDPKNNNFNYRPMGNPTPLSENPATPPGYENTYVYYDKNSFNGVPFSGPSPDGNLAHKSPVPAKPVLPNKSKK